MPQQLTKGQNAALSVNDVVVSIVLTAAADLSALLVTAAGKVRSDDDFVFFNQPAGPGVRLQPGATGQAAELAVTLSAIPADVEQVRAVITLDDAASSFGRSAPPTALVSDTAGNVLYEYRIEGLDTESIVIALELYRRQGAWKVRAVGQGYAGGFAALVTDHGVSVDDAPAPTPVSTGSAPTMTPPAVPPHRSSNGATAGTHTAPAAVPDAPEISLTKQKRVNLSKGQKVTLRKDGGVALTHIRMGLGWDPVSSRGRFGARSSSIDLDASAVMFAGSQVADIVYYGALESDDRAVVHSGDNLTGDGDGDDEVITVDLPSVASKITAIIFVVTSYRGQTFEQVANAFCRLVDSPQGAELARFTLQGGMPFTAVAMAKVYRQGGEWKLQAIGEGLNAKTAKKAVPHLGRFLND
ncbi:stress protein [Rhodococcus sp. ABRD24]|uniref:TerD family protein n=1 Tax=Rhodococcus sp. ABRD24 TaxID=2507582 RepID=UPI00103EEC82|nr:TerD family protein [Rhodococcus sp. ABRD24]QBJ97941.1 stress protein [Rhodococcus sp. ABRD24]